MENKKENGAFKDTLFFLLMLGLATTICFFLARIVNDNNTFAMPVFILAVAFIARFTKGYCYGIVAAVLGVFAVNYLFTYPFHQFSLSVAGYPLTFSAMLIVSIIISTLTTQTKKQEKIRYEAEKEKMRANLLRSVSHDIRTPLASIMGASSTLLENSTMPPADRKALLEEINKDAHWLVRMTENLLSVTKFSGEDVKLKKTDEVVEEIISSAIVKFRKNYPEFSVTVDKPDEILMAPMDATLIEQVLLNLFENTALHGEKATGIWIKTEEKANRVYFTVGDDGVGIPPHILNHILDGTMIVSKEVPDRHRNMGIGLSVCNSIIIAHGGELTAGQSNRGGAEFSFWLPIEEV